MLVGRQHEQLVAMLDARAAVAHHLPVVAQGKLAYQAFLRVFSGPRWEALAARAIREVDDPTMKIVVCVKQVPDTWAEKTLQASDSTLDRDAADGVMNELDEYAIEESLKLVEANGGEVVVLSMGPGQAADTVRKALSMGATSGFKLPNRKPR